MEKTNLEKLLDFIYVYPYKLTRSETAISQKQRNELKYNLTREVVALLKNNGLKYISQTTEGFILEIQHEEFGLIPVELNLKIKNIDFDVEGAAKDFENKVKAQLDKKKK